ncbi:MAG: cysteine--tRNA ligase [Conexivisphaerales archaeon]|jgi:cysteinyl-tRNA synthetase
MPSLGPSISLKDTLTGERVSLDLASKKEVRIYVCGLTVYSYAHIGHAKSFVFFDVLRRVLKGKGFKVTVAQNFTDVDDKIIDRAKVLGVSPLSLAEENIKGYFDDFGLLNVERADLYPRATENIREILDFIGGLLQKGAAYPARTGVYFDVSKFPGYGKLSKVNTEELEAGARIEPDPAKRNPADFALWKFSDSDPSWDSPWGRGRPGWHIECSAMVHKYLGEPLDIHGGGEDLLFPHHENEIAQSETLTGKPLARIWIHVGLLNLSNEKMSKSLGNVIGVREAVSRWGPNTLRYFLLSNRYRNQVAFTEEAVRNSNSNWAVIEGAAYELLHPAGTDREAPSAELEASLSAFDRAISDDVDTPAALAELVNLSRLVNRLSSQNRLGPDASKTVGSYFDLMFPTLGFALPVPSAQEVAEVSALIASRADFRAKGMFKEADGIRNELSARKVRLVDRKGGTVWMKVETF